MLCKYFVSGETVLFRPGEQRAQLGHAGLCLAGSAVTCSKLLWFAPKEIRDLGQCEESLALKEVFFSTASRCVRLSVPQFPLQMGLMLLLSWHVVQGVNAVGLVWCSGDSLDC